jgi:hypothetical protein
MPQPDCVLPMQESRSRLFIALLLLVIFILLATILAGAADPGSKSPTADVAEIQTQAIETYVAKVTASAPVRPSGTSTPTLPPTATAEEALSGTPTCLGLRFVRDVTIPDTTEMTPAEVFTKSWLVENNGSCAWEPGFQVVLIGGVAMGGSPFRVGRSLGPGGQIQVSIKMAAPTNQTGTVQGTWRMTDAEGAQFGESLWVVIDVGAPGGAPSSTPTGTADAE